MEEQQKPQEYEHIPRQRWVWAVIGVGFLFFTFETVWEHGLHDWDWVLDASLSGMGFSFLLSDWQDPKRDQRWQSRILNLAWGLLFAAYVTHWRGLAVGLCMVGLLVLQTIVPKTSSGLTAKSPLGVVYWLLIIVLLVWFARASNAWIPLSCAAAGAILLAVINRQVAGA